MICHSKTCPVCGYRVNEMQRCASFCPLLFPDLFKLNVVLNVFKLSQTLLGIASKIVAIQHTHRRFLFLSSQYNTLSSQNNSLSLSPIYCSTILLSITRFSASLSIPKFRAIRFSRVIYHLMPLLNHVTKIKRNLNHVYKGDWLLFPTLSTICLPLGDICCIYL